jgi:hypothetical protein
MIAKRIRVRMLCHWTRNRRGEGIKQSGSRLAAGRTVETAGSQREAARGTIEKARSR